MGYLGMLRRAATNVFILLILVAVVAQSFPLEHRDRVPLLGPLAGSVEPFLFQTGLTQQWDMFSHTPPRRIEQCLAIRAELTALDGAQSWRDVLTIEPYGFRARTRFSRLRRFFSEIDASPDAGRIWALLAAKIARQDSPSENGIDQVRFVKTTSVVLTRPDEPQNDAAPPTRETTLRTVRVDGPGS